MSSESATNLTVTSSQSVEHVSNCVTQLNSNSIEIHVLVTILDHREFVLDHRVFVLDQCVFVLDHRVFVLDQWVFVLDHRVFGLRSSFLGLRFRHIPRSWSRSEINIFFDADIVVKNKSNVV